MEDELNMLTPSLKSFELTNSAFRVVAPSSLPAHTFAHSSAMSSLGSQHHANSLKHCVLTQLTRANFVLFQWPQFGIDITIG